MKSEDQPEERPEEDFRIVRLLAALEAIPDPVERVQECLRVGDQARTIQARIGQIRRRAVYEATLQPGATGRSVAVALGVSAKAVSQASSEFRQTDLAMLDHAADVLAAALDPSDPDLAQLLVARASTRSMVVLAQALLRTYPTWLRLAAELAGVDAEMDRLEDTYERAEYLCQLAQVQPPQRVRFPTLAFAHPGYDSTPPELVWPAKVLNAMPGVLAHATMYEHEGERLWSLSWNILPAERFTSVFDAGPDPQGWAVTEWLVWLARDFERAGCPVSSRVTSPPPYLNEPGETLTFFVEGAMDVDGAITAVEFAEQVVRVWSGNGSGPGTGYFELEWPERQDG